MVINVQRVFNIDPEVLIIAGANKNLHNNGLLSHLTDGMTPGRETIREAVRTLLTSMVDMEDTIRRCFTRKVVQVIFVLSPGYVLLPKLLRFVYTMVPLLSDGQF